MSEFLFEHDEGNFHYLNRDQDLPNISNSQITHRLILSKEDKINSNSHAPILSPLYNYYDKTKKQEISLIKHLVKCDFDCKTCKKVHTPQDIEYCRMFNSENVHEMEYKNAAEFFCYRVLCQQCQEIYHFFWKEYDKFYLLLLVKHKEYFLDVCDYFKHCPVHGFDMCNELGDCKGCVSGLFRQITHFWRYGPYPYDKEVICLC